MYDKELGVFMYKYKNDILLEPFDNMFRNFESIHNYDTRHKKNYLPQIHKIKTLLSTGPKIWNILPSDIQNARTIKNFKQQFCKHHLSNV